MAGSKHDAMLKLCELIEALPTLERSVFIMAIVQRRSRDNVSAALKLSIHEVRELLTLSLIHLRTAADTVALDVLSSHGDEVQ